MEKKRKKAVKVNTSIKKDKVTNVAKPIKTMEEEFYRDMWSFQVMPVPPSYMEHLAQEWVHYVKNNPDVLLMSQYHEEKGISVSQWDRWVNKNPTLQEAREFVKRMIATRRELGGLMKKYDTGMICKVQQNYDKSWRESEEWRASLREKVEGSASGNITVVMERFPNSPLVPEKRKIEQE